jgi:hypothetical protein
LQSSVAVVQQQLSGVHYGKRKQKSEKRNQEAEERKTEGRARAIASGILTGCPTKRLRFVAKEITMFSQRRRFAFLHLRR